MIRELVVISALLALSLPPIIGMQETQQSTTKSQGAQTAGPQKPREPLPVNDIRDIEDRKFLQDQLQKLEYDEDEIYKILARPRLNRAPDRTLAIPDKWSVVFTFEVKELDEEVRRIESQYGVSVQRKLPGSLSQIVHIIANDQQAEALSKDLRVRFVEEGRYLQSSIDGEEPRNLRKNRRRP